MHVFRELETADMLVAELLQTLDSTQEESMRPNQVSATSTAVELELMRNSCTAIMNTLTAVAVLIKGMKTLLNSCGAEHTSEVSAACKDLHQQLDGYTAFLTEELAKSGKKLEAIDTIIRECLKDEQDVTESLKLLYEWFKRDMRRNISPLGKPARVAPDVPLPTCDRDLWNVEKWTELKEKRLAERENRQL